LKTYATPATGEPRRYEHTRPIHLPDRLEHLSGPTTGTVTLPPHLDWSASNTYDLTDPKRLATLYGIVIREAASERDLSTFLDETVLRHMWRRLHLPPHVRHAWESAFPDLSRC